MELPLLQPPNAAETVCEPGKRVEVDMAAEPADKLMASPEFVPSMANCTDPQGTRLVVLYVTVAVKVTEVPYVDGLSDDVTVVVVGVPVPKRGEGFPTRFTICTGSTPPAVLTPTLL